MQEAAFLAARCEDALHILEDLLGAGAQVNQQAHLGTALHHLVGRADRVTEFPFFKKVDACL